MQLLLFGYAINLNLRHLDAGVADQANSAASRALVQDMVATGVITPRSEAYTPDQLMQALRRGEISVGIVVPADFERRRFDGREAADLCKAMDAEKIAMRFGDFHSRRLAEYLGLTDHGGMLRVSMVHYNTIEEVDRFTTALDTILAGEAGLAKAS